MKSAMWRYASAGVALIAVFYAGFVSGRVASPTTERPVPDLGITRADLLDALEPSPSQRTQLESVMAQARLDADSLMRDLFARIRDVTNGTEAQMREILSLEQGEMLDTLIDDPLGTGQMRRRRSRN